MRREGGAEVGQPVLHRHEPRPERAVERGLVLRGESRSRTARARGGRPCRAARRRPSARRRSPRAPRRFRRAARRSEPDTAAWRTRATPGGSTPEEWKYASSLCSVAASSSMRSFARSRGDRPSSPGMRAPARSPPVRQRGAAVQLGQPPADRERPAHGTVARGVGVDHLMRCGRGAVRRSDGAGELGEGTGRYFGHLQASFGQLSSPRSIVDPPSGPVNVIYLIPVRQFPRREMPAPGAIPPDWNALR